MKRKYTDDERADRKEKALVKYYDSEKYNSAKSKRTRCDNVKRYYRTEKGRQKQKEYREKNKEKRREWLDKNRDKKNFWTFKSKLKVKYGITVEMHKKMFVEQQGKCAICKREQDFFKKVLQIDHCHQTKKVRGLLCYNCNRGLGMFNDSPERLATAVGYLKR